MFTAVEREMARRGFVYLAKPQGAGSLRNVVRNLDQFKRGDLVFDWPAYEIEPKGE